MKKALLLLPIIPLILVSVWFAVPPSHDREWRGDYSVLPTVTFGDDEFTVTNIRNWDYAEDGKIAEEAWVTTTIAKEDIDSLYFVLEPFSSFKGIAHTMLAVTLTDGSGYVMSVEARREVGETYEPLQATVWPMYEYMFVWATERDMYGNSEFFAENDLYWYELDLTPEQVWQVVHTIAQDTQRLAEQPRWYNPLFANCTNVLARNLNRETAHVLPWDIAWLLPGYSTEYLYEQGLFSEDGTTESLTERGYISPFIEEAYDETNPTNFSNRLRELVNK